MNAEFDGVCPDPQSCAPNFVSPSSTSTSTASSTSLLELPDDVLRIIWNHLDVPPPRQRHGCNAAASSLPAPLHLQSDDDLEQALDAWPRWAWLHQQAQAASTASWASRPQHALHCTCRTLRLRTSPYISSCVVSLPQPPTTTSPPCASPSLNASISSHPPPADTDTARAWQASSRPLRFPKHAQLLNLYLIHPPVPDQPSTSHTPQSLLAAACGQASSVTSLMINSFTAEKTCDAVLQLRCSCPLLQRLSLRTWGPEADAHQQPDGRSFPAELAAGLAALPKTLQGLWVEVHDTAAPWSVLESGEELLAQLAGLTRLSQLHLQPRGGIRCTLLAAHPLPPLPLLVHLSLQVSLHGAGARAAVTAGLVNLPALRRLQLSSSGRPAPPGAPHDSPEEVLHSADLAGLWGCPQLEHLELRGLWLSAPAAQTLLWRLRRLTALVVQGIADGEPGERGVDGAEARGPTALRQLTLLGSGVDPEPLAALQLGGLRRLSLPGGASVDMHTGADAARRAAALLGLAQLMERCWVPSPRQPSTPPVYELQLLSDGRPGPGAAAAAALFVRALAPLGRRLTHLVLQGLSLDRGAVDALRTALPGLRELQLLGCSTAQAAVDAMLMLSVRGCNVVIKRQRAL